MSGAAGVLFWVDAPRYCAGFEVHNGKVTRAAPILGWARGKALGYVLGYLTDKGFTVMVKDGEEWARN